ncbi:MAG: hypothetical protein KGQ26_03540 [Rhodospirillales bacterium]|nr:hypothetical protein [Rhodospirillales bacterium]
MKSRRGQAAWIIVEALHQLGRIATLLVLLVLVSFGLLAYRLSQGPVEIPELASRLATRVTGEGVAVHMAKAELAWAGYHKGGAMPLLLRLADIQVVTDSGGTLADIPYADLSLPVADLFGGRQPVLLSGTGATFPGGNVPVSWYANLWPGAAFTLQRGAVYVTVGAGSIGSGENSVALSAAHFVLAVSGAGNVDVTNGMAQLAQRGQSAPRLTFSFHAHRDRLWLGQLNLHADAVQAQDLPALWPPSLLPDTRKWVTRNITAGTARDAQFTFEMSANGDLSHFQLQNAQGWFSGDGLTLTWLRGAAPIEHLNGVFTLPGADTAVITANAGETGGVNLKSGSLVITDLTAKDQFGDLKLDLAGQVQDVLAILAAPPLNLLNTTAPEIKGATGTARGSLGAIIPFKKNLAMADVALGIHADLTNVQMATPIPGISFSKGTVSLTTDGHTLNATAKADLGGEPASVTMNQNFSNNGDQALAIKGTAGPAFWHAFGVDTPSDVSSAAQGSAPFEFSVSGPPNGQQEAELRANLTPAGLALPLLGWQKIPGSAASLEAFFTLYNGDLADIQSLDMEAPALSVQGQSRGRLFTLRNARIGRSQASGTLIAPAKPGAPWVLRASGAVLDLRRNGLKSSPGAAAAKPAAPGAPWQASLAFQTLYVAKPPAPGFADVSLTASGRGYTLAHATGTAQGVNVLVAPVSGSRRSLNMQGDDAGTLLQALGVYGGMRGGRLNLQTEYGDGPAKGVLKLSQARLVNAPGFIKILQAATLYGVAEAVSGPGLLLDHATFPFTLDGGVLTLHGADAYSESLGFTASGTVNTGTGICNLDTTIIPAYALNALPGKIPLLGRLFSAEKGGGLIAMRAHVQGPLDSPQVRMNPFSALTPGFLRGVFGLSGAKPSSVAPPRN